MPKLNDILTQLSDLNPEVEYNLNVSENCISVSTVEKPKEDDGLKKLQEESEKQKKEIEELKKANMQLLGKLPVEEDKTAEDILYSMFGKNRKGVNENG